MNQRLARKITNRLLRLYVRVSAALHEKCLLAACLLFGALHTTTLFGSEPPITDLVFAPDAKSLVAVSQSGLQLFSWPDLTSQRTIKTSANNLHCVVFSPSGKQLAVGGGNPSEQGIAELFSWPQVESVATLDDHTDSILNLAWLNELQLLTASLDREIKQWDLSNNEILRTLAGHSRSVSSICVLRDGNTLVSTGEDQSVRVWDLKTGKLIRSLNQHTKPVHALALRPTEDGLPMVASAAADRTIRLWQPTIGRMVRYVRLDAEPLQIAWFNESLILAACVDGHLRVIDANEVTVTQDLPAIKSWAYALAVHPSDGSVVVAGANGQIRRITLD